MLRLSFATDKHSSTIAYAFGLLQTGKVQLKALLAETKAANATKVKNSMRVAAAYFAGCMSSDCSRLAKVTLISQQVDDSFQAHMGLTSLHHSLHWC